MRLFILLPTLFMLSTLPARAQADPSEIVLFGAAAAAEDRPQFTAELGLLPFTGLTGDPSLNARVGLYLPNLRSTVFVGFNTPHELSELATENLFSTGEQLDTFWDGEVQVGVRLHPFARRYTGPFAELALGYEAFELRPRGNDRDEAQARGATTTVENGFVGVGAGYVVHVFGDLVTLNAGARAVLLFGGPEGETAGDVPIEFSWGFITPDVRIGIRL